MAEKRYPITWDGFYNGTKTTTINWSNNPYTWDDVAIIEKIAGGGGDIPSGLKKLKKEEKKKCVRLIMKRKGIKVYDEEKCVQDIDVYIKYIQLIHEEMKSLKLVAENVSI